MSISCNTMARHRGSPIRSPILSPIQEALLRDKMGRVAPLPGWAHDEWDDEPDPDTYWDIMVGGMI